MLLEGGGYDYNKELVKYLVVIVGSPFWWPFVKAAWQELDDSLREEGGLFGEEPDRDELIELAKERGVYESPMISEPISEPTRRGFRNAPRMSATGRSMLARNPNEQRAKRRGFREDRRR